MMKDSHYFFLLQPNPFPLLISISSFNMMFSFFIFLKYNDFFSFLLGLIIQSIISFLWWFFYSSEFNLEGKASFNLEKSLKFSMILFISSEVFFFFSFFWSYFHFFLSPTLEIGLSWPPVYVLMFDYTNVPLINTLVLLTSGVTVTLAHFFICSNSKKIFNFWMVTTITLGIIFTILQLMEYKSSFFTISDGNFGASFFVLTGFHGIHVLIGTMFLLITLIRSNFSSSSSLSNFINFELAVWYWHFVDVVWIFLFFFLYYFNF